MGERNQRTTRSHRARWLALPMLTVALLEGGSPETYGDPVKLGNGTARTFIVTEGDHPTEIGITLTEAALTGLPGHNEVGAFQMPDGHSMYEYVLPLPAGNPTPFKQVVLNWNPGGHEPKGVYDTPHFDFHFYTIDAALRSTIDPRDSTFMRKAELKPAAEFIPEGYAYAEGTLVPGMGVHWIDPKSPEFNGIPFTRTFIFGAWDGKLTFAEPMITKAYLESKPDSTFPVPRAKTYDGPGYHPTNYRVRWDGDRREYRVSLGGLERH